MRLMLGRLHTRLGREDGFTMATVMGAMVVVMLLSVAAVAAAGGDINLSRYDQDDKQAYAAAEAGVNDYLGQLSSDSNYWAKCTNVPAPGAVNQKGVSDTDRKWRNVPGSNAQYSIELIPRSARAGESSPPTACNPSNPVDTMVEDGNIRIRVTGRARINSNENVRTINATFRRAGFLDFLYYTNYENQDPAYVRRTLYPNYDSRTTNGSVPPKFMDWIGDKCQRHWWGTQATAGKGRGELPEWKGQFNVPEAGGWYPSDPLAITTDRDVTPPGAPTQPAVCGEIYFGPGDEVKGPFHSEDTIHLYGNPSFGTPGGNDRVEVAAPDDGTANAGWVGSGDPVFNTSNGKLRAGAASLQPPVSNKALKSLTLPGYSFTGQTKIVLNGDQMTVTNGGTTTTKSLPSNGVIYVDNGTCGTPYDPTRWNRQVAGCGDVRLEGSYSKDLTIGAANDIVITNTTKRITDDSEALLGLIADGFVRIWHPVNKTFESDGLYTSCDNVDSPTNVRIDAAILTLSGSFTVDNYWCGAPLGNLTVFGAIAQNHRGVVSVGQSTGYVKKYSYNTALKFRSPPQFLDPIQSAWRILRQGEQSPPCGKSASACS